MNKEEISKKLIKTKKKIYNNILIDAEGYGEDY